MWDSVVVKVDGDELLSTMTVKNTKTGELTEVKADEDDGLFGLFGFIGQHFALSLEDLGLKSILIQFQHKSSLLIIR